MILNEDRFCHSRPLLVNLEALNVYLISLFLHLNFTHFIPKLFHEVIKSQDINIQLICPILITVSKIFFRNYKVFSFRLDDLPYGTIFLIKKLTTLILICFSK